MSKLSIFILSLALFCAGCNQNSSPSPDDNSNTGNSLASVRANFEKLPGKWTFTGYLHAAAPSDGEATIEFTPGTSDNQLQAGGRSFINHYGTAFSYSTNNETSATLTISQPVGMTKMGGSAEMMQAENAYLNNLKKVTKVSVEGSVLKLYVGEPATEIMNFKK